MVAYSQTGAGIVPATEMEHHMPNKAEEKIQDCRELATQELEVVAGGMVFGVFALAAYHRMNQEAAAYAESIMSRQW
jgi:hypothetical protein